jgi:hypothetical protein
MDVLSICNMALGSVGARAKIASLSDNSREAEVCNLHYELVRDSVFSAAYWRGLRRTARLVRVATADDTVDWDDTQPPPPWLYGFRLPANLHRPRYLDGFARFEMQNVDGEQLLITNSEFPILTYTATEENPNLWGTDLQMLVVAQLAVAIAIPVSGKVDMYRIASNTAQQVYAQALVSQANEEHLPVLETLPDWITVRGAVPFDGETRWVNAERFFYPAQALTYAPS